MNRRDLIKTMALAGFATQPLARLAQAAAIATENAPANAAANEPFHKAPFYMDGLSFLPEDIDLIAPSGLNAFIADVSAWEEVKEADGRPSYKRTYRACKRSMAEAKAFIDAHSDILTLARTGSDIEAAQKTGKCAIVFQVQGADSVEGGFDELDDLHQDGLKIMQLTHHRGNLYAGGAMDIVNKGLSLQGEELITALNARDMVIDLSHASVKSAEDALRLNKGPIVNSHGAARALLNNARCMPDHIIRGIADQGGAFGVFMMSFWLTTDTVPTEDHYLAHIKHIANIAGVDAVGIANDFPIQGQTNLLALNNDNAKGVQEYMKWWLEQGKIGILGFDYRPQHVVIPSLNSLDRMERIDTLLAKGGFTSLERAKIMGGNWRRVLS